MKKVLFALIAILTIASACGRQQGPNWEYLFNGTDLEGWTRLGGVAEYKVVDGTIVGTSTLNTPNTFLRTDREFGDFILEFEFKVDDRLNSGVQFRSLSTPEFQNGRVHGYQFEIDPAPRAWTGGIFDEARRGWLYPLTFNQVGRAAFNNNEWNTARLEAIGNSIRTWVNGIPTADLIDDMTATGFIALQVHSIYREADEGSTVAWRNIRILTEDLERFRTPNEGEIHQINVIHNTISEREAAEGWELLWDGRTTGGWHGIGTDQFPANGWRINDGILTIIPENPYSIMFNRPFENFWLSVDFRVTSGASSGILYLVDADGNGPEYQVIDDRTNPFAVGSRRLGSLFDLIMAPEDKPIRWNYFNTVWIKVRGNHVEHWLNGVKLFSYERNTPAFNELVSNSIHYDIPNYGNLTAGQILLQNTGTEVSFRNVKIKEFD